MPERPDHRIADYQQQPKLEQKQNPWLHPWASWRVKKPDSSSMTSEKDRLPPKAIDTSPDPSRCLISEPSTPECVQPTLQRQESERREKLCWLNNCHHVPHFSQKRAKSALPGVRTKTPMPRRSFPDLRNLNSDADLNTKTREGIPQSFSSISKPSEQPLAGSGATSLPVDAGLIPDANHMNPDLESLSDTFNDEACRAELEAKWIISLSMHFRDGSDREKFFITYIEHPNRWRRVTISCDYRSAPDESLESDLKSLHYQRDKNARIYKAIRDSLPDIQFYETVTNLKLQTSGGRLHVHVKEDVNEITKYPPIAAIQHLDFDRNDYLQVRESDVFFESHLSGFVYRVSVGGITYIKKEISSPDTVEEFLYELNALASLRCSKGVIGLVGVVVDDFCTSVRGLLIKWASGGPLNDFLFESQNQALPWHRRLKWARQIVTGIAEIHEAGFIQGDCTISNVVLDANDDAKIVDINRRGCPIGWEPPEFEGMIRSGQRISLYIGVKSDLYQLGMILWAIAKQVDEPEREEKPLRLEDVEIPLYYRLVVQSCLSDNPKDRLSAKQLLTQFPPPEHEKQYGKLALGGNRSILDDGPTSRVSVAEVSQFVGNDRFRHDRDWSDVGESLEQHSFSKGQPNYELQDSLLAGIGPFEENHTSIKSSQAPMENETPFRGPTHQDSGLDFVVTDDSIADQHIIGGDSQVGKDSNVPTQLRISSEPESSSGFPMHQDSGFGEAAFAELQSHDIAQIVSSQDATAEHSTQLNGKISNPNYDTGDLLRGLGDHTRDQIGGSDIPRFDTPPPIS